MDGGSALSSASAVALGNSDGHVVQHNIADNYHQDVGINHDATYDNQISADSQCIGANTDKLLVDTATTQELISETHHDDDSPLNEALQPNSGNWDVIIEKVVPPVTDAVSYQQWIGCLKGTPVSVPANGQCLFLSLSATLRYVQSRFFSVVGDNLISANTIKHDIINILLTNLRRDVMLGLVDSKQELRRLYPGKPVPATTKAATAALFKHYLLIRNVSVMRDVPIYFWEGPHILRAVAKTTQLMSSATHLQLYLWITERLTKPGKSRWFRMM
ncbi:hypothetical protein DD237_007953 [Peronospora effusa]|uniref:OTU domain-containing protein n=1 Tax=Peronospora effusa TaxID=542832 RepID=A0A3R7XFT1_9STRA|nr:hypothetical protein DD237_007953 [Peronospora effusa]